MWMNALYNIRSQFVGPVQTHKLKRLVCKPRKRKSRYKALMLAFVGKLFWREPEILCSLILYAV